MSYFRWRTNVLVHTQCVQRAAQNAFNLSIVLYVRLYVPVWSCVYWCAMRRKLQHHYRRKIYFQCCRHLNVQRVYHTVAVAFESDNRQVENGFSLVFRNYRGDWCAHGVRIRIVGEVTAARIFLKPNCRNATATARYTNIVGNENRVHAFDDMGYLCRCVVACVVRVSYAARRAPIHHFGIIRFVLHLQSKQTKTIFFLSSKLFSFSWLHFTSNWMKFLLFSRTKYSVQVTSLCFVRVTAESIKFLIQFGFFFD